MDNITKNEFWANAFCHALTGVISTHSSSAPPESLASRAKKIADVSLEIYEKRLAEQAKVPQAPLDFEREC
jgi:hypothetical protein